MEKHELAVSLAAVFLLALLSNGLNLALSFVVITLCCVNDAKYIMRFPCIPDFVCQGRNQGQTLEALLRDNPFLPPFCWAAKLCHDNLPLAAAFACHNGQELALLI